MELKKDYWIDDRGTLISVPSMGHNQYAHDLLLKEFNDDLEKTINHIDSCGCNYPYEVLHKRGWVRVKNFSGELIIVGNTIDLTKPMRNTMEPAMNKHQLEVARNLCQQFDTTLHKAINDMRFW